MLQTPSYFIPLLSTSSCARSLQNLQIRGLAVRAPSASLCTPRRSRACFCGRLRFFPGPSSRGGGGAEAGAIAGSYRRRWAESGELRGEETADCTCQSRLRAICGFPGPAGGAGRDHWDPLEASLDPLEDLGGCAGTGRGAHWSTGGTLRCAHKNWERLHCYQQRNPLETEQRDTL
ncbi:hypothetical protein NDU88_012691 [Pleurodeles waltl]|uniref:Uncharacterized protein n=1 Tax=Pleurodeles waltl TaxID=8319 RepID=A0AAV7R0T1_PLEWA|nr:hypothetical protein NDU88_012691 [Pleurodeles waltl]